MYGQLGHGDTDKQTAPKLVEVLQDKTAYLLACGNFHNVSSASYVCEELLLVSFFLSLLPQIVVTTEQCIYYWGKNLHRPVS